MDVMFGRCEQCHAPMALSSSVWVSVKNAENACSPSLCSCAKLQPRDLWKCFGVCA